MESINAIRVSASRPGAGPINQIRARLMLTLPLALCWTVAAAAPIRAAESAALPANDLPPAEAGGAPTGEAAPTAPPLAAPAMPAPPAPAPAPVVTPTAATPTRPPASAGDSTTATATASAPAPAPVVGPPPPPYSLPWQLRPVTVGNVIRLDSATALYKDATGNSGSAMATMLTASYKITAEIAPLIRLGISKNDNPAALPDGSAFLNPIVGAAYSHKLGSYKLAGFLATTIPVGMGAGDTPDAGIAAANAAGIKARSAMDNAMFAVNYMTGIAGVDFAYVDHKFTAQLEATVFQLFRVRGDNAASATDSTRTNSTAGLHLGYFVIPQLSVGGELRYQRWLSHPTSRNAMGVHVPIADANMDTMTFAVGPRAHFKVGKSMWIRPGISYAHGLDAPLTSTSFNVIQVDVPVVF